ncbi:T9SS type A sorting domain-containing protein [Zunongwangia endophytica]|uniref:T9SS type A sorting domain-containing protein n=1 Tax=Zunongwangia endophytica TaxID=1808945 RepID=A0ABV8H0Z1_9FLAO|nr:T9SS type A sorting domain-containing protein [Zunongwangia endophytica]MDN3594273.1 T9SS type A sorting domain-containing protein [Zunongwangia endophytica]
MKNLSRIAVLVLALVLTNTLSAKDIEVKINDDKLVVELDHSQKGSTLVLTDTNGEVLFRDALMETSYKKALDLHTIPTGTYFLDFEKDDSILTTVITKNADGVTVNRSASKIFFKPFYKTVEDKVLVSFTNPGYDNATFKVYDQSGNLMSSSTNNDLVVKKTFDFSEVPAGKYVIALKVAGHTITKTITLG